MSFLDDRQKLRNAVVTFIEQIEPTHFLTLNFNATMTEEVARRLLGKFLQRVDRRILGPRYTTIPKRRVSLIAFFEHPHSNTHWHCLCRFDPHKRRSTRRLRSISDKAWKDLWERGQVDLQRIKSKRHRLSSYVTKDIHRYGNYDRFVVSSQFWSS